MGRRVRRHHRLGRRAKRHDDGIGQSLGLAAHGAEQCVEFVLEAVFRARRRRHRLDLLHSDRFVGRSGDNRRLVGRLVGQGILQPALELVIVLRLRDGSRRRRFHDHVLVRISNRLDRLVAAEKVISVSSAGA